MTIFIISYICMYSTTPKLCQLVKRQVLQQNIKSIPPVDSLAMDAYMYIQYITSRISYFTHICVVELLLL